MNNNTSYAVDAGGRVDVAILASLLLLSLLSSAAAGESTQMIHVDGFDLPRFSSYLSADTRVGIERYEKLFAHGRKQCDPATKNTGAEIRACESKMYPPIVAAARQVYDVRIEPKIVGGVQADVITPAEGVSQANQARVLINVHGGSFKYGARFKGQLEGMPLAAIGKYKVVAIDYRMAPEHRYPAASIDVAAVYRALLNEYEPSSIGLYGCSAGGRIVGQAVALLAEQKLPSPGAVGILCSPPTGFGGDSNFIVAALQGGQPQSRSFDDGYFKGARADDPAVFPGDSDAMLAKFPPTLLMTSTRDYSLSPMVQMHARLVRVGVPTELHIFEGLRHGEFLNIFIPESTQAARTIAAFFNTHLTPTRRLSQRSVKLKETPALDNQCDNQAGKAEDYGAEQERHDSTVELLTDQGAEKSATHHDDEALHRGRGGSDVAEWLHGEGAEVRHHHAQAEQRAGLQQQERQQGFMAQKRDERVQHSEVNQAEQRRV